MRVNWYRFRATLRRSFGGYLGVVVVVASLGGLAMGALAAARRTQSSFHAFLAHTNPSDLAVLSTAGMSDLQRLARLPHVKRAESAVNPNILRLAHGDTPAPGGQPFATGVLPLASLDGLYFDQDRVTVTSGTMADPTRDNEFVVTPLAAKLIGLHVGQTVTLGFYNEAQSNSPGFGTAPIRPATRIRTRVVGIVVFNQGVVQDDVDRLPTYMLFTPALARRVARCCATTGPSLSAVVTGLQLERPDRDLAAVETELGRARPGFDITSVTSVIEGKAQQAIKPESLALAVSGFIAAAAVLLIAGLMIGRQLGAGAEDVAVLRALGAGPVTTVGDGLIGIVAAVVIGAGLAIAVAVALSPLAPIGPARSVAPDRGFAFDATVVALGIIVLVVVLGGTMLGGAYRRVVRRGSLRRERPSRLAGAVAVAGLPAPAVTGIRFAVESGRGRRSVPVRSATLGAALAIVVVVVTLTFGASLRSLVSHPRLYGWNWDYELVSGYGGLSNIPEGRVTRLLRGDRDVASWSGIYLTTLKLDGQTVPALATSPNAAVGPPLLSGHSLARSDEVVLGGATLSRLHKRVGDTVQSSSSSGVAATTTRRLTIVGTATLPAIGVFGNFHLEMGSGAIVPDALIPHAARGFGDHDGPQGIFVRLRPGVDRVAALRSLRRLVTTLTTPDDGPVSVASVQRPAEIVNYHAMAAAPEYVSAAVAVGAVIALALTLVATVRRRRHDLALLNALGFTPRQLIAVVAWQSSVAVGIGTLVGLPLGIITGRVLWDVFARTIHVVPAPTVPVAAIVVLVVAALALANLIAALPARTAARTPTVQLLRTE